MGVHYPAIAHRTPDLLERFKRCFELLRRGYTLHATGLCGKDQSGQIFIAVLPSSKGLGC
jgi:hypothetical protein